MSSSPVAPAARLRPLPSTYAYFAAFIGLGLISASLGPTLPGLAEQTGAELREISRLFLARSTGYMLGSYFGGRLYDRIPGNPVMAAALLIMALGMATAPLLPTLWILAAVLLVIGLAEGTLDVGGNTLLVWIHRSRVGPYMNALHFMFGLGAFLSPLVIAQAVAWSGGIRLGYWLLAVYVLPVLVWLGREASPIPEVEQDRDEAIHVNWRLVGLIALFMFLYVGAEVGFGGWIYTYAVSMGLVDETAAFYLTSLFWGALTLGRLAAIPIATRVRPRTILLWDIVGAVVSVALILVLPQSVWAMWVGIFGAGFALASIFPTLITWAERRITVSGLVTSIFLVGASLGGMLLPWLIGQLFEGRGPQITMILIMGNMLVAAVVYAVLMIYGGRPKRVEK
ncbi:MAG: MFS transporter [Caldilineaceae bacterium]|nr:MFS transporter [Caldilineaceae bacterium]